MARTGKSKGDDQTTDAWLSEAIIREIIVQRHPPKMPLREQEIADRYGVSRPSAREALRLAAQAGFVEILPWRGARVVNIGIDEFVDILGMVEDIYARCAALAAERMPESAFAELDRHVPDEALALRGTGDKRKLYRIGFTLGAFVSANSGSPVLHRMHMQVGRLSLWQHRLHWPGTAETQVESVHAYRLLVAAIKSRQPDVAAFAARAIVRITRRVVQTKSIRRVDPVNSHGPGSN